MTWNWRTLQRTLTEVLDPVRQRSGFQEPRSVDEWEARLVEAGVSQDVATEIAKQMPSLHQSLGRGSAAALIEGAALTFEIQACAHADVERNMRDVREVERLLGAFSGELEKLDEVLEVLAAYAQRMRKSPSKNSRRILH